MASVITATTTSGLTQSADNSGVLQLASGTGNLVTVPSVTGTMALTTSGTPVADMWYLSTTYSNATDTQTFLTSNIGRIDFAGTGTVGVMTEASGVFTFPQTGLYRVVFATAFYSNSNTARYCVNQINVSTNGGSSYTIPATSYCAINAIVGGSNTFGSSFNEIQINVTNTSNVKVKFSTNTTNTINVYGGPANGTYMLFTRLGNSV
jgi:hypothetical protein